jgi:hypothetical protein
VAIHWPIDFLPQLAAKDQNGSTLKNADVYA